MLVNHLPKVAINTYAWDPAEHPRDPYGRFVDVVRNLQPGQTVRLPSGTEVTRRRGTRPHLRQVSGAVGHELRPAERVEVAARDALREDATRTRTRTPRRHIGKGIIQGALSEKIDVAGARRSLGRRIAKAWDERAHPRDPSGPDAGQWVRVIRGLGHGDTADIGHGVSIERSPARTERALGGPRYVVRGGGRPPSPIAGHGKAAMEAHDRIPAGYHVPDRDQTKFQPSRNSRPVRGFAARRRARRQAEFENEMIALGRGARLRERARERSYFR